MAKPMTATEQPIAVPATVHVFHMLGIQITSGDLAHLQGHLPSDDVVRAEKVDFPRFA